MFAPIFEEVAKNNPDIFFGKVDTEKNPKLGIHFQVRSIPTLMIIREGIEVFYHSGMVSETDLQNVIDKVKALDMKEVEKKIEKD
jgi:thioredoxin 1